MGIFDDVTSYLLIGIIAVAFAFIIGVAVICLINGIKEEKKKEQAAAAAPLLQRESAVPVAESVKEAEPVKMPVAEEEPVKEEPVKEEIPEPAPVIEEPVAEPVKEEIKEEPIPVPEPVKEEPKPEPVKEDPVKEEISAEIPPVSEPVKEEVKEPEKKPVKPAAVKKIVKKKPDDWSKYDGEYEGYYYDPEDACYYEGKPSAELAKKLAAKKAELDAATIKAGKKVVIKKIAPPFATLTTPKNIRQTPIKAEGFDEADIYGKYVIEHVGKEYFYTLYSSKNEVLYESGNYASLDYCKSAIQRFKTHALVGVYTIEEKDGKFGFVLKRKSYTHRGAMHDTLVEAEQHKKDVKYFAQTDIIREQ